MGDAGSSDVVTGIWRQTESWKANLWNRTGRHERLHVSGLGQQDS